MPRVYVSQEQREQAEIERQLNRIKMIIMGKMAIQHIGQRELGSCWGMTQPAVKKRLDSGNISIIQLWKAREILGLTNEDILSMTGGEK